MDQLDGQRTIAGTMTIPAAIVASLATGAFLRTTHVRTVCSPKLHKRMKSRVVHLHDNLPGHAATHIQIRCTMDHLRTPSAARIHHLNTTTLPSYGSMDSPPPPYVVDIEDQRTIAIPYRGRHPAGFRFIQIPLRSRNRLRRTHARQNRVGRRETHKLRCFVIFLVCFFVLAGIGALVWGRLGSPGAKD